MMNVSDDDFLTDEALLNSMDKAASRFNHAGFAYCENILLQRYVKFTIHNLDEFDVPLNLRKLVEENFPDEVAERFIELKRKLYPGSM